jgi:hypothetical protein
LLLVDFLLSIDVSWLRLVDHVTSSDGTGRHAVSTSCAVSVKKDACDRKGSGEEQATISQFEPEKIKN